MHALALLLAAPIAAQEIALVPDPGTAPPSWGWNEEVFSLRSQALGEELHVYVAKPPSWGRVERRYPALYLLDGQHYFPEVLSAVAALVRTGQIPELLVVGIESRDRRADFTPEEIELPDVGDRARAGRYLDFLEQELVPAAEATLQAGWPRVLLGHAHAGMLVLHAVARRPRVFPWALALDAPVRSEQDLLTDDLLRALREPERPPLRVVSARVLFGWSTEQWLELHAAARADDLLVLGQPEDEAHESMVLHATYRGLQALFADASMLGTRELSALETEARYRALAPLYGAEVLPPAPLMRRLVEDFLMEGYGARAGEWLARYAANHGEPPDLAQLSVQVAEVAAQGEPSETVAGLLALPRATPEELAAYLGEWQGTTWVDDRSRAPLGLRLWVEGGVVRGELTREQGPPREIQYLRRRPDGALEFGLRNRLRPRGLLVWEEREPGGKLEGSMGFRGIRFTPPAGQELPVVHFELERVDTVGPKD